MLSSGHFVENSLSGWNFQSATQLSIPLWHDLSLNIKLDSKGKWMLNRFDIKLLKAPTPPVQETCCSTVFSCARTCMKFIEDGFWWVLLGILLHVQLNSLSIYCLSSIVIYFLGTILRDLIKKTLQRCGMGREKAQCLCGLKTHSLGGGGQF